MDPAKQYKVHASLSTYRLKLSHMATIDFLSIDASNESGSVGGSSNAFTGTFARQIDRNGPLRTNEQFFNLRFLARALSTNPMGSREHVLQNERRASHAATKKKPTKPKRLSTSWTKHIPP